MDIALSIAEQKTQRRSKRFSIGFHLLLLLIMFFFLRWEIDPGKNIDTQYAVAVNFDFGNSSASFESKAESGASAPEADENKMPEPVVDPVDEEKVEDEPEETEEVVEEDIPDPIDPVVTEILEEESDVVVVEDIPVIEDPEPEVIERPKKVEVPTKETTKNTSPPTSTTGKKNGEDDSHTSTKPNKNPGSGKSTSGDGDGSDKYGNDDDSGIGDGGSGTGEFDDSGDGIFGRRVIYRALDKLAAIMTKNGRIAVKTCVDRRGRATYVEIIQDETTIRDRAILKKALDVARSYKFEEDYSAPREQCGKITFILDVTMFKVDFE